MEHLVAMGCSRSLCRQADDEPLQVASQDQEHALTREVNRRNLKPMARTDDDQGVFGETRDGLMDRRSPKACRVLKILKGKYVARLQFALHQQVFDAIIGEFEVIDPVTPGGRAVGRSRPLALLPSDRSQIQLPRCHLWLTQHGFL